MKRFDVIRKGFFWKTIGLDILFFLSIGIFALIGNMLAKIVSTYWMLVVFSLLYFLGLIFIYSIFKQKVIGMIYDKYKKKLIPMYILNILIFLSIVVVSIALYSLISYIIKLEAQRWYFVLGVVIICFVSYFLMNIMQFLVAKGEKIELSFSIFKSNISKYLLLVLVELGGLVLLYLIYIVIFSLIKNINWLFQMMGFFILLVYNGYNRILIIKSCKIK
jgi:hypothetical protein